MMDTPFSPETLDQLESEVDRQLSTIAKPASAHDDGLRALGAPTREQDPLAAQKQAIETTAQEPARSFLAKFAKAARKDVCEPNGVIYEQWRRYEAVTKKDALKVSGGVLAFMGWTGAPLATLAVAVSVHLVYLGTQAFCDEG